MEKAKEEENMSKEFAAMEEAAMKAYQEDLKRLGIKPGSLYSCQRIKDKIERILNRNVFFFLKLGFRNMRLGLQGCVCLFIYLFIKKIIIKERNVSLQIAGHRSCSTDWF